MGLQEIFPVGSMHLLSSGGDPIFRKFSSRRHCRLLLQRHLIAYRYQRSFDDEMGATAKMFYNQHRCSRDTIVAADWTLLYSLSPIYRAKIRQWKTSSVELMISVKNRPSLLNHVEAWANPVEGESTSAGSKAGNEVSSDLSVNAKHDAR